jgi:glycosyltransferase involved in cell wall biosynthesis
MAAGGATPAHGNRRILLIIDSLGRGGAQRQAFLLIRGLAERGYAAKVLALNDDTDALTLASLTKVAEVEVLGKARIISGLGPLAVWRRAKAWQPSVILTMLEFSDVLGRIAGRLYGRARVVTSIRSSNLNKRRLWLALDRATMGWADRVVFNTASVISSSQKNEGVSVGQVCLIPNGVEIPAAPPQPASRGDLGIHAGCRLVLTVGRLQEEKRFDTLLAALAQLPKAAGEPHLLIAGAGRLHQSLNELAAQLGLAQRVHFLGKRQDIAALLALADVFVLPSAWEGMPNAVMEAMAAGCPIVATRVHGILELLPDSSYAWLVEPGRPHDLAEALAQALLDPAEAQKRATRALERAKGFFSVERMVERYEALFQQLATRA